MKPWHINRAVAVVERGGIIAYPTEAVYGLGCSPDDRSAVERIFRLKRRKPGKGLILVGYNIHQFDDYLALDQVPDLERVLSTWPGPVTWIIPAKPGVTAALGGGSGTLAVRISAHPAVRALCRRAGVLVSTSANPSGSAPARDFHQVRRYFGQRVDMILPGRTGGEANPTEIRDALSGAVLRSSR